jgi:hypothetical protein
MGIYQLYLYFCTYIQCGPAVPCGIATFCAVLQQCQLWLAFYAVAEAYSCGDGGGGGEG